MTDWRIENCCIYICVTVGMVSLYYVGAGYMSLWPLVMLACISHPKG